MANHHRIGQIRHTGRSRLLRRGSLVGIALLALVVCVLGILAWRARLSGSAADLAGRMHIIADIPLSGGSSRFDYQSLDPQTGQLFIAHLGASIVSVFDTRSQKVVADIPGIAGVHGVLAVPELRRVYATATDTNHVVVIDEQTRHVLSTIPGGSYPDGMAYDPQDQRLFVSDEGGQTETVIDLATNQRIATIPLGGEAGNTQYDPVSGHVLVAVQTLNQLIALSPVTNHIVAHYALPGCQHDHSLLLNVPARLAFVTCDGNNVLQIVDMHNGMHVLSTQTVGEVPDVLAFDTQRHLLYVACESGVVSLFEQQGHRVQEVGDLFVASSAHSIAVDQQTHRVYLPLEAVGGKPVLRIAEFNLTEP